MTLKSVASFVAIVSLSLVAELRAQEPATKPSSPAVAGYPFEVSVTGKGRPMILIPGLACSGDVWKATVGHFSTQYECHVLTIHGFAGQKPFDGPFIETLRDGVTQYIEAKHLSRPVIVGHSIGGFFSYVLGAESPKSVGPIISIDGLPFLPAMMNPNVTQAQTAAMADNIEKRFATLTSEEYKNMQAQSLGAWISDEKVRADVIQWGATSDIPFVGRAMAAMLRRDLRAEVSKIQSPVLLIGAGAPPTNTDAIRKGYEDQVSSIAHHTVVFAEKSHHFVMYDEPQWMWEQMEAFLKANP